MKTQLKKILNTIISDQPVTSTEANGREQIVEQKKSTERIFSSTDLWNIQRGKRPFFVRRYAC